MAPREHEDEAYRLALVSAVPVFVTNVGRGGSGGGDTAQPSQFTGLQDALSFMAQASSLTEISASTY